GRSLQLRERLFRASRPLPVSIAPVGLRLIRTCGLVLSPGGAAVASQGWQPLGYGPRPMGFSPGGAAETVSDRDCCPSGANDLALCSVAPIRWHPARACGKTGIMGILITLQGPDAGRKYPLEGCATVLGRQADCTICLPAKAVSRQHAQIVREDDAYFL